MPWLWSDTLAALLIECDRVEPDVVRRLVLHPVGHRLPDGGDPLELARRLLHEIKGDGSEGADRARS